MSMGYMQTKHNGDSQWDWKITAGPGIELAEQRYHVERSHAKGRWFRAHHPGNNHSICGKRHTHPVSSQETEERHRDELNKIREKFVSKNRELIYSNDRRKKQFAGFESELSTTDFEHRQTERAIEDEERENTTLKTQKRHVEESLSELDAATRSKRLKKKVTEEYSHIAG